MTTPNSEIMKTRKALSPWIVLLVAGAISQSCSKDVLEGQPSWLGESIYETLEEEGCYTYTLQLIDDLDQTDVLLQTGSKTLFVADDDDYEEFFQSNDWGVKKYSDLSESQKKLLLYSSMINNAYLMELLSNVSGDPPVEGQCMRRESAASVMDSIAYMSPDDMPDTEYWDEYRTRPKGILLMRDNTAQPMIHFLPAYMTTNSITDEDLTIITNGESTSTADMWVNGKKVIESDITCKNGYIHKVDGVMLSSENMAQIIGSHANTSIFSYLLDRFCAPYYDSEATSEYNRLYDNNDSVFTLRYFAETGNTGYYNDESSGEVSEDPSGNTVDAELTFDPGWNQYIYDNTSDIDLHYDAGAILVPNDEAMLAWWNDEGKVIQDMYSTWSDIPLNVLVKLMNVNMLSSFAESVPSKFDYVVDPTTKVSLGVQPSDVDSCFMGCNGVVYVINKVYPPADYSSVSFPALINEETMNIIYWAIENLYFEPYLNSMDSYYSFFIPTNDAMLWYVDPCSYGNTSQVLYQFYYDDDDKTVGARRYTYFLESGTIGEELNEASDDQVENRLTDLLNNLIVVGDVTDGDTYYKTKSGGYLKVENPGQSNMTVMGGLQMEQGTSIAITTIYEEENGNSYIMEEGMPLTSQRSAYSILKDYDEFSKFYDLIYGSGLMVNTLSGNSAADYNISIFDAYNYTMYVPTNDAIEEMHDAGYLPYWSDIEELSASDFGGDQTLYDDAVDTLENVILNFIKYHIQDNALMIGSEAQEGENYESFAINETTNRYYVVEIYSDDNSMTVTDLIHDEPRNVVTSGGLYNLQGREYWIEDKDSDDDEIYNASDIVIHQIDGVLLYTEDQMRDWRERVGLD